MRGTGRDATLSFLAVVDSWTTRDLLVLLAGRITADIARSPRRRLVTGALLTVVGAALYHYHP